MDRLEEFPAACFHSLRMGGSGQWRPSSWCGHPVRLREGTCLFVGEGDSCQSRAAQSDWWLVCDGFNRNVEGLSKAVGGWMGEVQVTRLAPSYHSCGWQRIKGGQRIAVNGQLMTAETMRMLLFYWSEYRHTTVFVVGLFQTGCFNFLQI